MSTSISQEMLKNLLILFLFIDFVAMILVGGYLVKTRGRSNAEKVLEEIRDLLARNPHTGCDDAKTPKKERRKRKGDNKKRKEASLIDSEKIYYNLEETTEEEGKPETNEFALIKNAIKGGPKLQPLLKTPLEIDEVLKRSRQMKPISSSPPPPSSMSNTETSLPRPPPPPPLPSPTSNTESKEKKGD